MTRSPPLKQWRNSPLKQWFDSALKQWLHSKVRNYDFQNLVMQVCSQSWMPNFDFRGDLLEEVTVLHLKYGGHDVSYARQNSSTKKTFSILNTFLTIFLIKYIRIITRSFNLHEKWPGRLQKARNLRNPSQQSGTQVQMSPRWWGSMGAQLSAATHVWGWSEFHLPYAISLGW